MVSSGLGSLGISCPSESPASTQTTPSKPVPTTVSTTPFALSPAPVDVAGPASVSQPPDHHSSPLPDLGVLTRRPPLSPAAVRGDANSRLQTSGAACRQTLLAGSRRLVRGA